MTTANTTRQENEFFKKLHIIVKLETNTRGAWGRGVGKYAEEMTEKIIDNIRFGFLNMDDLKTQEGRKKVCLNGAPDWENFSWGGCSLIYDEDICKRLCAPWEIKRTDGGRLKPNAREEWLDTQARALYQAFRIVDESIERAMGL